MAGTEPGLRSTRHECCIIASNIAIRTVLDRLRYAVLFEGILIVLLSVSMALLFSHGMFDMAGLYVLLCLLALVVHFVYNYFFDIVDVRNGRIPTERSRGGRVLHAIGFELTLVVLSLPIIMWWLGWGLLESLTLDIVTMSFVVLYTYFFTLAYDRLFPVGQAPEQ